MASIRIGINMAGAISAGAYTAGVLDFLTEALDSWEQARLRGEPVPLHDVSLEVLSGASAGGMCAAIASLMLHEDFEHIHDTSRTGTTNRLYESWVNQIDIKALLQSDDLRNRTEIMSLLDSNIVNKIAASALTPGPERPKHRAYISPDLALYLSLTNLRGTPYSLNGQAPGSVEETTFFFGDRIRFQV
ncbi:MAG: patatin-like phospholipase family protein, partial [Bryobacteraceae bacterium]